MTIVRYHVRDASGSISWNQTEAQKAAIVAEGGSVMNTIRSPGTEAVISSPVEEKSTPLKITTPSKDSYVGRKRTEVPGYDPSIIGTPLSPTFIVQDTGDKPNKYEKLATDAANLADDMEKLAEKASAKVDSATSAREIREAKIVEREALADLQKAERDATAARITSMTRVAAKRRADKKAAAEAEVVLDTGLPDPSTFVGIPGPASGPKPGSVGDKIQTAVMGTLEGVETAIVGFETEMRGAGKELGAGAQEALEEGDLLEAALMGASAFTARAGVGIIEGASFMFRPLAWGKTAGALFEGVKGAVEHPEDIPGGIVTWAEHVAHDPGSIVEFAGDILGGMAVMEVVKTIKGSTDVLSRVETLDIDVKTLPDLPETKLTPTVTKKRIPKVVAEIMEAELDEFTGAGKILGVADEGGITLLETIDLPESAIDDLIGGKKVTIKEPLGVDRILLGGDDLAVTAKELSDEFTIKTPKEILQIDELALLERAEDASFSDPLLGDTGKVVPRSELHTYNILEEGVETRITIPGGESTTFLEIPEGEVKFGGPWHKEGFGDILGKGEHRYDVKGLLLDDIPDIVDDLPEFKPLEPGIGPKTPLSKTFGIGDDVIQESIVKQITEGVTPLASVIKEPATVPVGVPVGLGLGAALQDIELGLTGATRPPAEVSEVDLGLGTLPGIPLLGDILDTKTKTEPTPILIGPVPEVDVKVDPILIAPQLTPAPIEDTKPIIDPFQLPGVTPRPPKEIPDILPVVRPGPKPDPTDIIPILIPGLVPPKPEPKPPIVVPIQIPDVPQDVIIPPILIVEPIQEPVIVPLQDVVQKQKAAGPLFLNLLGTTRPRIRTRVKKPVLKRRRVYSPFPLGWEERKYPVASIEDVMGFGVGRGRRRAPGRPSRGQLEDPSNILLGSPKKPRKAKKPKKKRKSKRKKRRKKG